MIFQLKAERNYHIFYQILSNKKPDLLGEPDPRALLPHSPRPNGMMPSFFLAAPPPCSPPFSLHLLSGFLLLLHLRPACISSFLSFHPFLVIFFSSSLLVFSFSSLFALPSPRCHSPPPTHFFTSFGVSL